jgi:biotin operon repressor
LALAAAQATGAETEAAYARHDLGALYVELDQPAQAVPLLAAAHATWSAQNNDLLRLKSEACLGLARLALGEQAGAEALANQGWSAFQQGMPQGELPQAWLWTLYSLLDRLQRQAEAHQVLRAAYDELQRQATAIANPDMRRSFYERVPLNRAILAAHDRLSQKARQISVTLARQDAPLGRSLVAAELVAVRWTVDAPEDELIPGKSARRQYRLQRLLTEATAQGAAPTDDQLAAALGVSRRTILRDMEMLAQAGFPLRTRRRSD